MCSAGLYLTPLPLPSMPEWKAGGESDDEQEANEWAGH